MISMARILGAPVIEPPGKVARRRSTASSPSLSSPVTVETRWCTVAKLSSAQISGVSTRMVAADPAEIVAQEVDDHDVLGPVLLARQQLARRARASSSGVAPRGRVPLIGRVSTRPPRSSRNRSGEAEAMADLAEVEEGRERRRVARAQAEIEIEGVDPVAAARRGSAARGWPGRCRRRGCTRSPAATAAS